MNCTIFKDILSPNDPNYIKVSTALDRIRTGKSMVKVEEIRNTIDKDKAQSLKKMLPSVCFSGEFSRRDDKALIKHSGFIVLDFDLVDDLGEKGAELSVKPFCYALWVSPSGNGLKMLVRVADGAMHRRHFAALKELMPEIDSSGVNESRVCYESYDPNIFVNRNAEIFTRTTTYEKIEQREILTNDADIFKNVLKWISNKGWAFSSGQRNIFIFRLASACCRFGIYQETAGYMILNEYPASNDFTNKEVISTIKSAYKRNAFGSAIFDRGVLIDKATRKEVKIEDAVFDMDAPTKDVIYGSMVKEKAHGIYMNGYESVKGIHVQKIDQLFKQKRGEITLLTGIGNYGKSAFYKWHLLLRVILYGEKYASFCPEDNPPEEYYHDFVEMLLGCNCTPINPDGTPNMNRPAQSYYDNAYDFVSAHIFYLYPKDDKPTPQYTRERFLELIVKEKIDGVAIDPFNQMAHEYGARTDKYLEAELGDYSRFAQANNIYLMIIAHPTKMPKSPNGNYECPDVFDIADGAMWNNKMDNILVYHRPFKQTDPSNRLCEFHSKKIRRQKTVGHPGFVTIDYIRRTRRYEVDGHDAISEALRRNDLSFNKPVVNYKPADIKKEEPPNAFAGFPSGNKYNPADWHDNN